MGAEIGVDVFWDELADLGAVLRPVGVVADDLEHGGIEEVLAICAVANALAKDYITSDRVSKTIYITKPQTAQIKLITLIGLIPYYEMQL